MPEDQRNRWEAEALVELRSLLEAESSDGLRLRNDLENNPICSISFDETVPCITVVWRRYATSIQLRFVHENVIHMLEKHGASKILGDDTALATIHTEDEIWIAENWMPRAMAAGLKAVASKTPASHFGRLAVEGLRAVAPAGLAISFFDEMGDARRWLTEL